MEYYSTVDKYARELIDIIAPQQCGKNVFQNTYLMMNIFSFFESGWYVNHHHLDTCLYYDIFGRLVTVHQVTSRFTNPYYDKGVSEETRRNSYYVGPLQKWAYTQC